MRTKNNIITKTSNNEMCLIEKPLTDRERLKMILATLPFASNTCLDVAISGSITFCLACKQNVQIDISTICGCRPTPTEATTFIRMPLYYSPWEMQCKVNLQNNVEILRQSGWYYENDLDWQGATKVLKEASPGAFLLRNSADQKYEFTLSVQTDRGPTSVRLHYKFGYFRLDCEPSLERYMPKFREVVELIQHYINEGERDSAGGTIWVDNTGCPHSRVLLKYPMRKAPSTLRHTARMAIQRILNSNPLLPKLLNAPKHRLLPLPICLLEYLDQYPYNV